MLFRSNTEKQLFHTKQGCRTMPMVDLSHVYFAISFLLSLSPSFLFLSLPHPLFSHSLSPTLSFLSPSLSLGWGNKGTFLRKPHMRVILSPHPPTSSLYPLSLSSHLLPVSSLLILPPLPPLFPHPFPPLTPLDRKSVV